MGKLTFVGLGLGPAGISLEGIRAVQEADKAYLEYYTSPHEPKLLSEIETASGRQLILVDRAFVEDGTTILDEARKGKIVLAVQGDPMIATTHGELRVRALRRGIQTEVIHGATIPLAAASETGLHHYKFGRTVTYTSDDSNFHAQVYRIIHQNLLCGLHTLLLLEFDVEKKIGVDPGTAMKGLLRAEANFKRGVVGEETFAVVLSRVGSSGRQIKTGLFGTLKDGDFGEHPHTIIIPGSLHFTEKESLQAICALGEIPDNALHVRRTAQTLVPKYLEKTKNALKTARGALGREYEVLLENVETYAKDAENFLANQEDELAMLSIGYAEGLLDSLRFTDKLKIEW